MAHKRVAKHASQLHAPVKKEHRVFGLYDAVMSAHVSPVLAFAVVLGFAFVVGAVSLYASTDMVAMAYASEPFPQHTVTNNQKAEAKVSCLGQKVESKAKALCA